MLLAEQHQLIKDCLKGKHQAQKALYDQYAPSMLGICYRYTKNIQDAENILQDGFIKVFTQLHTFRNEGELGGWIRRIMVNTALSYLKRNKRYAHELVFEDCPLHPVTEEDIDLKLEVKEIAKLIRQLPTGYQTIFNLHAVEGYTHVDIGSMLGISAGTSRSQYARARTLLIEWIGNYSSQSKGNSYGR